MSRTALDLAIDETYLRLQSAQTMSLKKHYLGKLQDLCEKRNALRTAKDIEDIEKAKGLR